MCAERPASVARLWGLKEAGTRLDYLQWRWSHLGAEELVPAWGSRSHALEISQTQQEHIQSPRQVGTRTSFQHEVARDERTHRLGGLVSIRATAFWKP